MFLNLLIPSNEVLAAALPPLTNPKAKDDSIDNDFKMVTAEEWKANYDSKTGTGPGQRYTVQSGNASLNFDDYMNDMNYMVKVKGYQHKKPLALVERGWMPLLRPLSNGSAGRLFFTDLDYWILQFNGDKSLVERNAKKSPITIKENLTGKLFNKYYIRDIARYSGATVEIQGLNQYDTGFGFELSAAIVETTSYPDAEITVASNAKVGDTLDIGFKGREYYPASHYGIDEEIRWSLTVNGVSLSTGTREAKSMDYTKPYKFDKAGNYKIELKVTDQVNRSFTTSRNISVGDVLPPPPPKPNIPPHAEINTVPYYYWPETVEINTISYDEDGEIVSEEWLVDGQPNEGNTWKSSRVTEKTSHTAYFRNEDDLGATGEAFASFDILPTTPTAKYKFEGHLKQNRAIKLDAKASDLVSPVEVAPIDYSRTSWKIVPKSEGLTMDDIKIRPNSDPSIKQALFKKPGTYELQLTVTNVFDETSEVLVEELIIRPDELPISSFSVDKSVYLRNVADSKHATVTLTDNSASVDGDTIQQRIWYVEFDSNNDGIFGTAADGGKQVISSANFKSIQYKTKHVGHYRFSLEVKEAFGVPTYEEFVEPHEYLRDNSDVLDSDGVVSTYMNPVNHNQPLKDKAIKVDNVPPIIDFAVKRKNSMYIVLDFGGMDTATQQHKTGSRPGNGVNNGGGGGRFDHYYYTYDTAAKNSLTAYAGSLESDLRMKGLDATVSLNNCYYQQLDIDGECVRDIPVYDWVDYGSYSYSSYSGTSPYSGSWEVTSSSSQDVYKSVPSWCYYEYTYKDGSGIEHTVVHSHAAPCSDPNNVSEYKDVYSHTEYSASLRKYNSDWRFVVTNYTTEGCSSTEQVDTTDFTTQFSNYAFTNADYKYYFRMDNKQWTWRNNATKRNSVINTINNKDVFLWSNSDNALRTDAQNLLATTSKDGRYSQYNTSSLQANIQTLKDDLLNNFQIEEDPESFTIVLGDKLDYTTVYEDFENDPELQREWKFIHDETSVNDRIIDSQPSAKVPQSGLYISSPMQLNEVGTYTVSLRAKDNPLSNVGNDSRFAEYRKWSDEEIVREYKINVHRRPIADFTFNVEAGTLKLSLDPNTSFDPDHQFNWSGQGLAARGIVEYTWEKYVVDGVEYSGRPPATLVALKDYYTTLRVKDVDGAYGYITKVISTKNVNLRPVALFDSPNVVLRGDSLNLSTKNTYIRDRSYDPNGDPLTNYNWTIKRQGTGTILWSNDLPPTSFASMGLPVGKYVIGLTVWDIPKFPPALQSELYEREIVVVDNNPPNSCFELSRTAISVASVTCSNNATSPYTIHVDEPAIYTDKSTDPDGHALISYSWTVEQLDVSNQVIKTWNTGSAPKDFSLFGGIGKYRITQTVFDNPPAPLNSKSGSYTRYFNVVKGPQAPYAMFDYLPLEPIGGQTIDLADKSWDEDGTVIQWEYRIEAPNGTITTQVTKNPKILNAQIGTYKVTLNVWDDTSPTRLKSKVPAYKEIVVKTPPPNKPPVPLFIWNPFKPFLGETFNIDPDGSYDLDGTIVSYSWSIRSKEGVITNTSARYPSLVANSEYYDVTLTVRDDKGSTAFVTQRINVNIAKLEPFITHTNEWKEYWVEEGQLPDTQDFLAGEKFVIRLKTTPANRVEGKVDFGGTVGEVNIPSSQFTLIRTSQYEYEWEAILWRDDFEFIEEGQYLFNFKGYHPVNNPTVESNGVYFVNIVGNIYDALSYRQSY